VRPALPLLPGEVAEALQGLAESRRTTLAAVLACAVIAVHAPESAGERVVVGLTVSNRDLPQLRSTVGCLADQLPLVVDIGGDPTFAQLLGRVRESLLDAYDHRLPLGMLLPWLRSRKPPVFAVNLNYVPSRREAPDPVGTPAARTCPVEFPYGIAKTRPDPWWLGDALLAYRPRFDRRGLGGEIEGDAAVHDAAAVRGYGRRFAAVLEAVARAPQLPLSAACVSG
jgi:non-ribosomal peptide synthetase component F